MIFAIILAGGIGSRMGDTSVPKQFLEIEGKPIIVHTVEKFIANDKFKKIIITCPKEWINHMKSVLKDHMIGYKNEKIQIIKGGSDRNASIINVIEYIKDRYGLNDGTIVVTHDGVRPFVSERIITDNISLAEQGISCDTVVKATDTIVESFDGKYIDNIPNRACLYNSQTPQSFSATKFIELYNSMSDSEKEILTDAIKVFVMKGEKVALVKGDESNMKITYKSDLITAESIFKYLNN